MVLLNTALCLPALEVDVLSAGFSVVAAPKRFILPGKRFALLPVQALPNALTETQIYHEDAIAKFRETAISQPDSAIQPLSIQLWGKCEFCQHLINQEKVQALSDLTIWKIEALAEHLRNQENLFLAFIRVYRLAVPVSADILSVYPSAQQINNLTPLAQYLDVDETQPVLEEAKFLELKQNLIDLKIHPHLDLPDESVFTDESICLDEEDTDELEPVSEPIPELSVVDIAPALDIINDSKWFLKIAEIGNSSDGFTFEKLVRKSFIELGFQNSSKNPKASLEPMATGGAGGLDFYANLPYQIVGECKATKTKKVPDGTPAQLIKLGYKILKRHYDECIKIVVAAGELTTDASQTSEENQINVIRPETLQKLVELKIAYPGSVDLFELRASLNVVPFGESANQRINDFISNVWQCLTVRSLLVETVRELSEQEGKKSVSAENVRIHYNAVFAKGGVSRLNSETDVRDLLIELSSPLTAHIGREKLVDKAEQFYFLQSLKIED
jgi:hypothetical protein